VISDCRFQILEIRCKQSVIFNVAAPLCNTSPKSKISSLKSEICNLISVACYVLKYLLIPIDLALLAWFVFHMMTPLPMWPLEHGSSYIYIYPAKFGESYVYSSELRDMFIQMRCSDTVVNNENYVSLSRSDIDYLDGSPFNGEDGDADFIQLIRYEDGVYSTGPGESDDGYLGVLLYDNLYLGRKWATQREYNHTVLNFEVVAVNKDLATPAADYTGVFEVRIDIDTIPGEDNRLYLQYPRYEYYVRGKGCVACIQGGEIYLYLKE